MQDDLALALRLADAADAVTLPRFRAADLRVTTKPDRSPVTDADTAAEEALRALITAERPADAVLGEEGGGEVTDVGRLWVLDPIDGTKNFSRGMPAWATLIALTVDGNVPGIDDAAFQEAAQTAKENCPVSKALAGVPEISITSRLQG